MRIFQWVLVLAILPACTGPQPEVVAELSTREYAYTVDDRAVYVFAAGAIRSMGADERELGVTLVRPSAIAANTGSLYWAENSTSGGILAIDKTGGEVRTVAADQAAAAVLADESAVYWIATGFAADAGIWMLPHASSDPVLVYERAGVSLSSFMQDAQRVYWCETERQASVDTCRSRTKLGGELRTHLTDIDVWSWAVSDDRLFYTTRSTPGVPANQLWSTAVGEAAPTLILETRTDYSDDELAANSFVDLAVSAEGQVYAATGTTLYEVSDNETHVVVHAVMDGPLRFDADHAYWRSGESIVRVVR